mmetsp:Transcript_65382/g.171273  ORF Transcript_65382/g.171273 Transcript_65382/m.171273 type:complete len:202 (-) Transcript_65382:307-912(-)
MLVARDDVVRDDGAERMPYDGDFGVAESPTRICPQHLHARVHLACDDLVDLPAVVDRLVEDDVAQRRVQGHARAPRFGRRDAVEDRALRPGDHGLPLDHLDVHLDAGVPEPVLLHRREVRRQVSHVLPEPLHMTSHTVHDEDDVGDLFGIAQRRPQSVILRSSAVVRRLGRRRVRRLRAGVVLLRLGLGAVGRQVVTFAHV